METGSSAFFDELMEEYNRPFSGWDLSYLDSRRVDMQQHPLWDYAQAAITAMQEAQSMLDMRTGGGERLAKYLGVQPVAEVYATEGYAPNFSVASTRLAPFGVTLYDVQDDRVPRPDASLDLVINRHGSYNASEVQRVLKPDKLFITQQVGDQTNLRLRELLGYTPPQEHHFHPGAENKVAWNLACAVDELAAGGWQIREQLEEFYPTRYFDVGAIVYYLKAVPWTIPDFSVERYIAQLVEIRDLIAREGFLDVAFHQFFIVAQR